MKLYRYKPEDDKPGIITPDVLFTWPRNPEPGAKPKRVLEPTHTIDAEYCAGPAQIATPGQPAAGDVVCIWATNRYARIKTIIPFY